MGGGSRKFDLLFGPLLLMMVINRVYVCMYLLAPLHPRNPACGFAASLPLCIRMAFATRDMMVDI
jgi:hypothetical protein